MLNKKKIKKNFFSKKKKKKKKEGLAYCRTDRVFADAAHVVLTRDSRARTGEFLYDEDVLRESGVTDFEQYSYVPGIVVCY